MSKNELEWFEFETRMRILVSELIEPSIQRISKDREMTENLLTKEKNTRQRLKELESYIGIGKPKTGWMENIENKITNIDSSFDTHKIEIDELISRSKSEFNILQSHFDKIKRDFDELDIKVNETGGRIIALNDKVQANYETITNYLDSNKKDLKDTYDNMMIATMRSQKISETASNRIGDIHTRLNDLSVYQDKLAVSHRDLAIAQQKLLTEKCTTEQMLNETSKYAFKIDEAYALHRQLEDQHNLLLRYIDKYLPDDIQICVSDNLYTFLDDVQVIKWIRFEEERRRDIRKYSTDFDQNTNLNGIIRKSVENAKRSDCRTEDMRYELLKLRHLALEQEKAKDEPKKSIFKRSTKAEPNNQEDMKTVKKFFIDDEMWRKSIDENIKSIKEQLEIGIAKIDEINKEISFIKITINSKFEELNIDIEFMRTDYSEISKKIKEIDIYLENESPEDIEIKNVLNHKLNQIEKILFSLCEFAMMTCSAISFTIEENYQDNKDSNIVLPSISNRRSSYLDIDGIKLYNQAPKFDLSKTINSLLKTAIIIHRKTSYNRQEFIEKMENIIKPIWISYLPNENLNKKSHIKQNNKKGKSISLKHRNNLSFSLSKDSEYS